MDNPLKRVKILNATELQQRAIEQAEAKRFEEIADKIIQILIEENVLTSELPRVLNTLTIKISQKIDKASIEQVMNKL